MPQLAMLQMADVKGTYNAKGPITSDNRAGGGPTFIPVYALRHEAAATIDLKTGLPTKEIKHQPLVITKRVDPSSPDIHEQYAKNAFLAPWELRLFHIPASGEATPYLSLKLIKARIASIRTVKPSMTRAIAGSGHEVEEIAFIYDEITWEAPANVPLGLNFGKAPEHSFTEKGSFVPDWMEERAKTAVEKLFGMLAERVKNAAKAELVKDGVLKAEPE